MNGNKIITPLPPYPPAPVKICDALMGSGKSSAAITFMNNHPDRKYVFITPYLNEVERIRDACPELGFVEPAQIPDFKYSKVEHSFNLILNGKNIASTHQAFKFYTPDMLDAIKERGYTLIIDESLETVGVNNFDLQDIQILIDAGYVSKDSGVLRLAKGSYRKTSNSCLGELFRYLSSMEIVSTDVGMNYFWTLSPRLIGSFSEVYVLTYMFEGQSMYYMFKMNDIPYEYIGVRKVDDVYEFCDREEMTLDYVRDFRKLINVLDIPKLNRIGDDHYSLSMAWYGKPSSDVDRVKNNMYNFFHNISSGTSHDRLWGGYSILKGRLKGKGYTNCFTPYNMRATNQYSDRTALAYPVNLFMNVGEKMLYQQHNLEVNEDMYALSCMVQWIWRSAVRNGKPVQLYLPSRRMRDILNKWIDEAR